MLSMPLRSHIITLRNQVNALRHDWDRLGADFKAGRLDVMRAQTSCEAAQAALDAGDDAKATEYMLEAYSAWSTALTMQMPASNLRKLFDRPDVGGRPGKEALAQRLQMAVDTGPEGGTLIARCRAAIGADEVLQAAFANTSDNAVRKAYRKKNGP